MVLLGYACNIMFFMLNSADYGSALKSQLLIIANSVLLKIAEHENFSANKYENANYCWHFIFINREISMLSRVEHEKVL